MAKSRQNHQPTIVYQLHHRYSWMISPYGSNHSIYSRVIYIIPFNHKPSLITSIHIFDDEPPQKQRFTRTIHPHPPTRWMGLYHIISPLICNFYIPLYLYPFTSYIYICICICPMDFHWIPNISLYTIKFFMQSIKELIFVIIFAGILPWNPNKNHRCPTYFPWKIPYISLWNLMKSYEAP